jgi:hypothetical protein
MNVATKLKPATEPAPVLPEQIRQKLAAAKAEHAALLNRQFALAERSVLSAEGEREYMDVVSEMSAVSARIEQYDLAIQALDARGRQQLKDAQDAELHSLQGRTSDLLDRRLQAAARFEAAVTEAVKAMREIAALGKAAFESWPGKQPEHGVIFGGQELQVLIAGELYRLGYVPMATGGMAGSAEMALPPPKAPTLATFNEPAAITPLVTALTEANVWAKSQLGLEG